MKPLKSLLVALLLVFITLPTWAETPTQQIIRLQASIDSSKAEMHSAGCVRAVTWVATATEDSNGVLSAFGITVKKDTADSMYVQIDFPLSSATGLKKAFLKGTIEELFTNYHAIDVGVIGRVKMRRDRAVATLKRLVGLIG